jgi:hypothetical protein
MKDFNDLEKLEELSKSLTEEKSVQKPKSKMPLIVIGAVIIVAVIIGIIVTSNNKNKQEESKPDTIYEDNVAVEEDSTEASSEEQKEPEKKEPVKKAKVGDTVKAETKYGSFEVKVVSAARTNWYDDSSDSEAITIRFEINNIDYVGEYDEGYLNGYTLDDTGSMTVLDSDGFKVAYYDIGGPTDGSYGVSDDTNVGSKAKVSYPYIVPIGTKEVTVNVNGQYEIPVEIGDEMVTY